MEPLFKLALTAILSLAPVDAVAEGDVPPAPQTPCEKKYEEGRQQLLKVMSGGSSDFNLRDKQSALAVVEKRCALSRGVSGTTRPYEICFDSYMKIGASVIKAEDSAKEACQILNDASRTDAACTVGQADCFRSASAKYRAAAVKIKNAKKNLADGVAQAKKAAELNRLVASNYAMDLNLTSESMKHMQKRIEMDPAYAAQVVSRRMLGERDSQIAIATDPFMSAINKQNSLEILNVSKLNDANANDLAAYSKQVSAANNAGATADPSTIQTGATVANEAVQANLNSSRFAYYAPKFEQELAQSESSLNGWAADSDRRAVGLAPISQRSPDGHGAQPTMGTPVAAAHGGGTPNAAAEPGATSPTNLQAFAAAAGGPIQTMGASRAVAYSKANNEKNSPAGKNSFGTNLAATLAAANAPAFAAAAQPASANATKTLDTYAAPYGTLVQGYASESAPAHPAPEATATALPSFSGSLAAAATAATTKGDVVADSFATLKAGAKALENPQVKAIVDSEMDRLGARAPASASLRDRLRERLAANVAGKLVAAKAKNEGTANGSMDSLLNEARTRRDGEQAAYDKSFEIGAAETDAEVARLMGKHDSEQLSEIPGALSSFSLFDRVHSAHTRFQKSGSKKAEVLSRNP